MQADGERMMGVLVQGYIVTVMVPFLLQPMEMAHYICKERITDKETRRDIGPDMLW